MWHLCDIWRRGCAGRFWTGNASDSACTRSRPSTRASTLRARKACGGCAWHSRNPDSAKGPRLCQSAAPFLPPQGLNNKQSKKLTADFPSFPFSFSWKHRQKMADFCFCLFYCLNITKKCSSFSSRGGARILVNRKTTNAASHRQTEEDTHTMALHQDIFIWWNLVLWIMSALRVLQNLPHSRQWNPPVDKCLASTWAWIGKGALLTPKNNKKYQLITARRKFKIFQFSSFGFRKCCRSNPDPEFSIRFRIFNPDPNSYQLEPQHWNVFLSHMFHFCKLKKYMTKCTLCEDKEASYSLICSISNFFLHAVF